MRKVVVVPCPLLYLEEEGPGSKRGGLLFLLTQSAATWGVTVKLTKN